MIRFAALALSLSAVFLPLVGQAAGSTVPATRLGVVAQAITANTLKPGVCGPITVALTFTGGAGTLSGPNAPSLLLGSIATTAIVGGTASDCVFGSAGTGTVDGGGGVDVCIGSLGTIFLNCETEIAE